MYVYKYVTSICAWMWFCLHVYVFAYDCEHLYVFLCMRVFASFCVSKCVLICKLDCLRLYKRLSIYSRDCQSIVLSVMPCICHVSHVYVSCVCIMCMCHVYKCHVYVSCVCVMCMCLVCVNVFVWIWVSSHAMWCPVYMSYVISLFLCAFLCSI